MESDTTMEIEDIDLINKSRGELEREIIKLRSAAREIQKNGPLGDFSLRASIKRLLNLLPENE
jgi:hypothetical protein